MKLSELQERAREIHEQQEAGREAQERRNSKHPSKLRIAIWIAEIIVLAAALEYFVIYPWQARRKAREIAEQHSDVPQGELVKPLEHDALVLPGLHEVIPAYLPYAEDLADGSRAAQAAQKVVSEQRKLPIEVANSLGIHFRLIPQGAFLMGSPDDEKGRWKGENQHVRTIRQPFYLAVTEVTNAQWEALMPTNPSRFSGAQRPVEEVTWNDCKEFIAALCEHEGVPRWAYRLPTEGEWEYACRAGTRTPYYFGETPQRMEMFECYAENSGDRTAPVASFRPNAWGLYDMLGNVWEWCQDVFRAYPDSPVGVNLAGEWRSVRGGNWWIYPEDCRAASRSRLTPTSHGNMLGFRLLRVIPPPGASEVVTPARDAE
ncbi:MAG: formylglycine-generating enzyme family protein [Candidatus Pacebacteria bacterium]|nr:formylglycine-generating enzyme family protein [Candidatus Paceibacterota bacterium]